MTDTKETAPTKRTLSDKAVLLTCAIVGLVAAVIVGWLIHGWLSASDKSEVKANKSAWGHSMICRSDVIDIVDLTPYPQYKTKLTCPGFPVTVAAVPFNQIAYTRLIVWHNSQTGGIFIAEDTADGPGGQNTSSSPYFSENPTETAAMSGITAFAAFFVGGLLAYLALSYMGLVEKLDDSDDDVLVG